MDINNETISQLTLKYSRDINLLLEDKRPLVIGALNNLIKLIENKEINLQAKIFFFENRILRNYLVVLDSNSDSVREASLKLVQVFNDQLDPSDKDKIFRSETQDAILSRLVSRINVLPFKEPIEEIRLSINKLLLRILKNLNEGFYKNISEVIQVCACLLQDKYPENKKQTCLLIEGIAIQMPELLGMSCRKLLLPLLANCSHSHSKVRKVSIETIGQLLILPRAGENLKDVFDGIRALVDDKNPEIREEAFKTLGLCLEHFGFSDIKQYETIILAELLSSLDDESEKVRLLGRSIMENFAKRRKILFEKFNS